MTCELGAGVLEHCSCCCSFLSLTSCSLHLKAVDDFVAVSVGPLRCDPECVGSGEPDLRLKGDLLFAAMCMGVRGLPLHVESPQEKKIFNDFMASHPKPASARCKELAKSLKCRSSYETTFPKLPSMLKTHYDHWQDNQAIVLAEEGMKVDCRKLLVELAPPCCGSAASAAIQTQLLAPRELDEGVNTSITMDDLPENPLPVPPAAAPGQASFVLSAGGQRRDQRRCCFPSCTKMASECNGFNYGMCKEVLSGRVVPASKAELEQMKLDDRRAQKKKQAAEARKTKKRQKNGAEGEDMEE